MDRAGPASPAGAVHVEEHRAVPFAERRAVHALQRPADRREHACRDVPGNDRIRNAGQPPVPQVHVGAAHFSPLGLQQGTGSREIGPRELANFNRLARRGHHRRQDAVIHSRTLLCGCALPHPFSRCADALCASAAAVGTDVRGRQTAEAFRHRQPRVDLHRATALRRSPAGRPGRQTRGEHPGAGVRVPHPRRCDADQRHRVQPPAGGRGRQPVSRSA